MCGKISKTKIGLCYIKNIANDDLVAEIKYRINNLGIDYLISSGQLEQLIEDSSFSLPQLLASERPDRVASYILEGRVAILVNRNSICIGCSSCIYRFSIFC
ncbi:MAG: spore germination protein [Clostridia bacterium]|nr:spore germination protein [Clostridia bacterium]